MPPFRSHAFTYSSPNRWTLDAQAESSASSHEWSHSTVASFSRADSSEFSLNSYYDIPVTKYSSLTGALCPVGSHPREGSVQPPSPVPQPTPSPTSRPTLQRMQLRPAQQVLPQEDGQTPTQIALPIPAQQMDSQSATPDLLGVQSLNVDRGRGHTTRRRAYILTKPPTRGPRQPPGVPRFCKVHGCQRWTAIAGKKLSRHRASHFPGGVGVVCPECGRIFSRSSICGDHLKRCNPQRWAILAALKGTQDAWGVWVGQDHIEESLDNDREYEARPEDEL